MGEGSTRPLQTRWGQVSTANNYGSDAAIPRDTEVVFSDDLETGLAGPPEVLAT